MITLTELTALNCLKHLENQILTFWSAKMVDEANGGFYGRMTGENILVVDSPKSVILNARILWTFSAAYSKIKKHDYLRMAARAYDYMSRYFFDGENGGVFWMVDANGKAIETKKQVYAQAFAIYALSEYYKISKDEEVLKKAISLFGLIEKHSFDHQLNGYLEAFDREWNLLADLRLSDKDDNTAKTMNTHLHLLEAYTNLYTVWPKKYLKHQLTNLVELFLERFISEKGHLHLFFDQSWNLKSNRCSYGHDIEGSWLLHDAAKATDNEGLVSRCRKAAIKLTEAAIEGLDEEGGLMNEGDTHGVTDRDKHWWPQAEALVGFLNAYQISGDRTYYIKAERSWEFIESRLVDAEHGEWHWMWDRTGKINTKEDKAGPWKCPYHNGRAMLEMMSRLA